MKKEEKVPMMAIPNVAIDVFKSKVHSGHTIVMYAPGIDQDGDVDYACDAVATRLSRRQYRKWRDGNVLDRLEVAVEAFKNAIELNRIHQY